MKITISTILFLCLCQWIMGQVDSSKLVKYSPDFHFKEGIYVNFDQVKNNDPIPKSRIIADMDYNDPDFFDKVLSGSKVYYYDNLGNRKSLNVSKLWGYCRNGFIYVSMETGFCRITLIGAISHFVATHTYYNNSMSPYAYNYYTDPYTMSPYSQPTSEMRQYVLDFNTGRIMDYTPESVGVLLMQDPALHDEYMSLRRKKMKQMMFIYIRKFNEKHPLYFPQN